MGKTIATLLLARLTFLDHPQHVALAFKIGNGAFIEVSLSKRGITGGNRPCIALTLVLAKGNQRVVALIGDLFPRLEFCAISVVDVRIVQGGLTRHAIPFLAGLKVALKGGPMFRVVTHAGDCVACFVGEIWKLRGTVTGGDITFGTSIPQRSQPP
ncbi:MAG TPA: hypothetical protein P5114_12220 [Hyphomicrobiaceae bacterium]|nr:hypothetical protein [Hyphomicrobiaceae bacterium]